MRDGKFAFVVTGVETGIERLGEGFLTAEPQGTYVLVRVTVTDIGNEAQMFSGASQKLIDAQGRRFNSVLFADTDCRSRQALPSSLARPSLQFRQSPGLPSSILERRYPLE